MADDTPYSRFWWVRDKRHRDVTIAKQRGSSWWVLGGLEGSWSEGGIREDYDILGEVSPLIS